MKTGKGILFIFLLLLSSTPGLHAQVTNSKTRVKVYYFHPTERCPIDQTIEDNTKQLMKSDFAGEIKSGSLDFRVINTDDKANASLASGFEINVQALYLVKMEKGKEIKNDLTEFAFSTAQANPSKFRYKLKEEVTKALK